MPQPGQPSYEELAAQNAELLAVVAEQAAMIESLRAEVAALRRQAGRDSSNSSQPPGQDGPAAKAKKKAGQREARRARPGRRRAGRKAIWVRAWRGPPGRMRPGLLSRAHVAGAARACPALPGGSLLPCRFSISRWRR